MDGEPARILGRKVVINNFMDATLVATKKSILIGDFSQHVIRDVRDVWLLKLEELYAMNGMVAFVAIMRSDAKVKFPQAFKVLLH